MRILAHRGLLNGANEILENSVSSISNSFKRGFDIEFDINFDLKRLQLVLSHNEGIWSEEKDINKLFDLVPIDSYNALNIKNLFTLPSIMNILQKKNLKNNFFFFDFELLTEDKRGCRFLMNSIASQGYKVAYRLSDRENYFDEYLDDEKVKVIWLDEFDDFWVKPYSVEELIKNGKEVYYVSPDLHGKIDVEVMTNKWQEMIQAGITGICTDYPILLNKLTGAQSND